MDFLGHLVDAPLANILILAGLLFLGIGAVGKVTGKIEPDKTGRMIAGALGFLLLIAGLVTHVRNDSSSKNSTPPAVVPVQPTVQMFSVTPAEVKQGETVTITWDVSNADDVKLDPFGPVAATGNTMDQPRQNTIYRLNATNKAGGKIGTVQQVIVKEREPHKPSKPSVIAKGPAPPPPNPPPSERPVYASHRPPPLPDYTPPPAPGDNPSYLWTPGSWYYDRGRSDYYWVAGTWAMPPYVGWLWTPPYWEYENERYKWNSGYWGPRVGFYGGINYGSGYFGSGYQSSLNHKSGNTNNVTRVSYNGGRDGIHKEPTQEELAAKRDPHIAAVPKQRQVADSARKDREQFFAVNHGRPKQVVGANLPTPVTLRHSETVLPTKPAPAGHEVKLTTAVNEAKSAPPPHHDNPKSNTKGVAAPKKEEPKSSEPKSRSESSQPQ